MFHCLARISLSCQKKLVNCRSTERVELAAGKLAHFVSIGTVEGSRRSAISVVCCTIPWQHVISRKLIGNICVLSNLIINSIHRLASAECCSKHLRTGVSTAAHWRLSRPSNSPTLLSDGRLFAALVISSARPLKTMTAFKVTIRNFGLVMLNFPPDGCQVHSW